MPAASLFPFASPTGQRMSRRSSAPGGLQTTSSSCFNHGHFTEVPASSIKRRSRRASSIIPGAGRRLKQARKSRAFSLPASQQPQHALPVKKPGRRMSFLGFTFRSGAEHDINHHSTRRRASLMHHNEKSAIGLGLGLIFPAQLIISCHEHGE